MSREEAVNRMNRIYTRAESDELLSAYDDAVCEYRLAIRLGTAAQSQAAFNRMNTARERLLDVMCQEECTQPLAGRTA